MQLQRQSTLHDLVTAEKSSAAHKDKMTSSLFRFIKSSCSPDTVFIYETGRSHERNIHTQLTFQTYKIKTETDVTRDTTDLGWFEGIICGEMNSQEKYSALIGTVRLQQENTESTRHTFIYYLLEHLTRFRHNNRFRNELYR